MTITIQKQLAGQEDILFGQGSINQDRGGVTYPIKKLNGDVIPYSGDLATADRVTINEQLDLNEAKIDLNEAKIDLNLANLNNTADVLLGDNLVGIKHTATGTVGTTQHEINERSINAFDFMTAAEITSVVLRTGTDVTIALQNAINAAATAGKKLILGAGTFNFTKLYLGYDAANNTGYPTGSQSGKLIIEGQGSMNNNSVTLSSFHRTVLQHTSATGVGIENTITAGINQAYYGGYIIKDLSILSDTTGYIIDFAVFHYSLMSDVYINNSIGSGANITECFNTQFNRVHIQGGTANFNKKPHLYSSGIGLNVDMQGGRFDTSTLTISGFETGMIIYGSSVTSTHIGFEPANCNFGVILTGAVGTQVFINPLFENITYSNIKVGNGAEIPTIVGGKLGAVFPDWAINRAVALKNTCKNGGNLYIVVQAGTTAGSGGPTGTGASITDGTVLWDYMEADAGDPAYSLYYGEGTAMSNCSVSNHGLGIVLDEGNVGVYFASPGNSVKLSLKAVFEGVGGAKNRTCITAVSKVGALDVDCSTKGISDASDVFINEPRNCRHYIMDDSSEAKYTVLKASATTLDTAGVAIARVSGTVNITALADENHGSEVTLVFLNSGCVVTHAAGALVLNGSADYTSVANSTLTLVNADGTVWVEKGRSIP